MLRAWHPLGVGKTVNVAVTGTAQLVAIPDTPMGTRTIRLVNVGAAITFIEIVDNAAQVATPTTSVPLLPNTTAFMILGNDKVGVSVIGTAANTLYITAGEGKS